MNKFFRVYTRSFFAPTPAFTPEHPYLPLERNYHVQVDAKNPSARRNPDVFRQVEAMRVDFHALANDSTDDFSTNLHIMEAEMREQEPLPVRSGVV